MLGAKGDDELLVSLLLASLVQDAHMGLATVKSLSSLTETTGKTIVDKSDLQDTLQCVQDRHGAACGGIGGNFNFISGNDAGVRGGLFSVRLELSDLLAAIVLLSLSHLVCIIEYCDKRVPKTAVDGTLA